MSQTSLLWSLQRPEGELSYLFGTMHIRDRRAHQWSEKLYPLIEQSDVYVGEMDLSGLQSQPPGPIYDMKAHFTSGKYEKLRRQILKSFGLDIDAVAHLHPLLIMSALTQQLLRNDHAISLDEHLWTYAENHEITTSGLESVEEQMQLLHSIEPQKLYRQLQQVGARPGQIRKFTNKTLAYYVREDIHGLYKLTKASMQHLRKSVIYQRNTRMCNRIAGFDTDKCYFISVGAGHLSGASGLISNLRKLKWQVKPVVYS